MLLNIQYLRAFAVINVVFFHVLMISESYGQKVNYAYFLTDWGQGGVDLFFVISGFIMVYIQHINPKSAKTFMCNRVIRIVPLYWTISIFFVSAYFLYPDIFRSFSPDVGQIFPSLAFVSLLFFDESPLVAVGWTLEYEMLYYLFFSFALLMYSNIIMSRLVLMILLIGVALMGYYDWIIIEFIFGMVCAILFIKFPVNNYKYVVFFIGVVLFLTSIIYDFNLHRVVVWGIPSALIVFSILYIPEKSNLFGKILGDASYSIYLVHSFAISVIYKISLAYNLTINTDILAIVSLFISTLAGVIVYYSIERPMTIKVRKIFAHCIYQK